MSRYFEPVVNAPADTVLPSRGSVYSAGYDFYAPRDIVVKGYGFSELIKFNVKAKMPSNEFLMLKIRSSLATKHGILFCSSGIVDADYYGNPDNDGNIGAMFMNVRKEDFVIKKGERCLQGIFIKYGVTDNDTAQGERKGGFGSTGYDRLVDRND